MKNLTASSHVTSDGLDEYINRLPSPQKEFLNAEKDSIIDAISKYDSLCSPNCRLEQLSPIWTKGETCTIKGEEKEKLKLAKKLYNPKSRLVLNRWEEITAQNGGQHILCPICESMEAREMDHYVPREKMPEFSAHLHNLIPLCHDCNQYKHAKWLVNGARVCFNAYFDESSDQLFICGIQINCGCPRVRISENPKISNPVLINTINELKLLSRYQTMLDRRLKEVIGITQNHYREQYDSAEDYMQSTYNGYKIDIQSEWVSFVDKMLYLAIIGSTDYYNWMVAQLDAIEHKTRVSLCSSGTKKEICYFE